MSTALLWGFMGWFPLSIASPWLFYGKPRASAAAQVFALMVGIGGAVLAYLAWGRHGD